MHIEEAGRREDSDGGIGPLGLPSGFLSGLGHEVRAPLNGILGNIELLRGCALDAEQREYMGAIELHANKLIHLINDLLDLTRMEAKELELDRIDFDLRSSLEAVIASLSAEAEQKQLALSLLIESGVPAVLEGDAGRLKQAVFNVVAAAIEQAFSNEILVRVEAREIEEERLAIEVRVSARDQAWFPEAFRGAIGGLRTDREADPTGADAAEIPLGLVVAQRIARMMEGELSFECSRPEGDALCLRVWARKGDLRPQAASPVFPGVLRGLKALVVDTEAGNREKLKTFLENWGLIVDEAGSTPAALGKLTMAAAAGEPFKLVLLDDGMSGMKGFDLAQQIKHRHDLSHTTIVLLTSTGMRGDAARCRKVGVAAYLTRPIRPSRLLEALSLALGVAPDGAALITRHSMSETRRAEWGQIETEDASVYEGDGEDRSAA